MLKVDVDVAQAELETLLAQVESGDEVTLTRAGIPVARLVPIGPHVPDDFDAPLPDDVLDSFTR